MVFLSLTVIPIGKRDGFTNISRKKDEERKGKGGIAREKTKRRSAPHESLIESIHGDSEEKIARSEIRMAGGVRGSGAKVCRVVTTRYSRTRTLKSSIPEERKRE